MINHLLTNNLFMDESSVILVVNPTTQLTSQVVMLHPKPLYVDQYCDILQWLDKSSVLELGLLSRLFYATILPRHFDMQRAQDDTQLINNHTTEEADRYLTVDLGWCQGWQSAITNNQVE